MQLRKSALLVGLVGAGLVLSPARVAAEGQASSATPVDKARIHAPRTESAALVVKEFSTTGTDLGSGDKPGKEKAQATAAQMVATAPPALARSLVDQLAAKGAFPSVTAFGGAEPPEGSMVLEGEFTVLNPGSRGARYFVGMGAGRSRVCVRGRVLDPAGKVLLEFDHCRSGAMGWFGGRAEGMMYTDVAGTAEKISSFIDGWARSAYRP